MKLKVLLPFKIFCETENVTRIVATTPQGSFGLLPRRLDCVAALAPGVLTYQCEGKEEVHLAVDEGVLVKSGDEVVVSVRNAIGGADLGHLREAVESEFLHLDEREKDVRSVLTKLETGIMLRLAELHHV